MISPHRVQYQIAIFDNYLRPAFEKATEPVRVIGEEGKQAMHQDDDNAAANGGKESGAAIDGPRQDRRQDNNEDSVKRGLPCERSLMSQPDHDQRGQEDDDSAEGNLNEGQIFRLHAQTKEWPDKIVERVHSE